MRGLGVRAPGPSPARRSLSLGLPEARPEGRVGLSRFAGEGFRAAQSSPARQPSVPPRFPPRPRACRGSRDRSAWALDLRRAEIPCRLPAFRLRQSGGAEGRHARAPDQAAAPATRTSTPSTRSTSSSSRATARPAWTRTFDSLMAGSGDEPGRALRPRRAGGARCRPTSSPTASCCGPKRASTTARG